MNDKIPSEMVRSFSEDTGKNVVIAIDAETQFPSPPFKGPVKKAMRNNSQFFTKMFNGSLSVTSDYIKIDNSKLLHAPKFDMGYEIELDYILTITSKNGRWTMNYFDKQTRKSIDFPFYGFMYHGGK